MAKKRAFTLIELLFAACITGIAVFSLLASYVACIVLTETANNITIATGDGQRVIEQIRSVGASSLASVRNTDWAAWAAANGCDNLPDEQVLVTYDDRDGSGNALDDDPLAVVVNVVWQERERARILDLHTLVTVR